MLEITTVRVNLIRLRMDFRRRNGPYILTWQTPQRRTESQRTTEGEGPGEEGRRKAEYYNRLSK